MMLIGKIMNLIYLMLVAILLMFPLLLKYGT